MHMILIRTCKSKSSLVLKLHQAHSYIRTSIAENLSLGPPNTTSLALLSLSGVRSSLCSPTVQCTLRRDCNVL